MTCPKCGYMMDAFDSKCPRCGETVGANQSNQPQNARPPQSVAPAPTNAPVPAAVNTGKIVPTPKQVRNRWIAGTIFGAFFLMLLLPQVLTWVGIIEEPPVRGLESGPIVMGEKVENSEWDGAVPQVVDFLNDNLKDPKSAKWISWGKVQNVSGQSYKYKVRCKYRAKNSFGAYEISNQMFYLDANGNVVNVTDID